MAIYLRCYRENCFGNKCGVRCEILTEHSTERECPFFKTQEQVETERKQAHQHLIDIGRRDLIKKYEYNESRKGQW